MLLLGPSLDEEDGASSELNSDVGFKLLGLLIVLILMIRFISLTFNALSLDSACFSASF